MEALALHIEGMIAEGEMLPTPSTITDPLPDWVTQSEIGARFEAFLTVQMPDAAPDKAPRREAV